MNLLQLPLDNLSEILIDLPLSSLYSFCQTNKSAQEICSQEYIWSTRVKQKFPFEYLNKPTNLSWRKYNTMLETGYILIEEVNSPDKQYQLINYDINDLLKRMIKTVDNLNYIFTDNDNNIISILSVPYLPYAYVANHQLKPTRLYVIIDNIIAYLVERINTKSMRDCYDYESEIKKLFQTLIPKFNN